MNEQTNAKANNITQIILVVLMVILIAIGGILVWQNSNQESEKDTSTKPEEVLEDTNSSSEKPQVEEEFDLSKFDEKKPAINGEKYVAYRLRPQNSQNLSNIGLNEIKKIEDRQAEITVDLVKYFELYGGVSKNLENIVKYKITNFSSDIKETYLYGFGSTVDRETAFYLMKDGTVEYTPIRYSIFDMNNGKSEAEASKISLKSFGKISGVTGVVKIVIAEPYVTDDNLAMLLSGENILGIKADGSFYDLSKILNSSSYYKG